jgi:DNA polymerase elongation subunit (family B)
MVKIYLSDYDTGGKIKDHVHSVNKWNKVGTNPTTGNRGEAFLDKNIYTYEADMAKKDTAALRYMIDNKIRSGVEVDDKGNILGPIDFIVPQRKWLLDFESYTFKEYTRGINPQDPINMVTWYDSYSKKLYTYYVKNPKWECKRQEQQCFKPFTKFPHEIKMFDTEAMFLDGIMEKVLQDDPDKFIAWNGKRYDFPKWKQRVDLNPNCLYRFSSISPLKSVSNYGSLYIKGRILFDLMEAYKKFTDSELASYALAFITKEENLEIEGTPIEKIPFKGTSGACWDKYPDIVFQRNVMDVLILLALDQKYEVVATYEDKQTEFGTLPSEVLTANRVIDTELLRMCHGEVILKTIQTDKTEKGEGKLLGARVVEPKPDEYEWAFQFDFSGEYPNLIQGFNISPETYVEYSKVKDFKKVFHVHYTDPKRGDMHFCFLKQPMGLLPRLIKRFKDKRAEYKKEQEKAIAAGEPEHVIKMWDRRQYNVKKNTNAIYGVMDYPKFRLHRSECTQATAVLGRISAECEYEYLPEADVGYGKGYTLRYGDTDSFFVSANGIKYTFILINGSIYIEYNGSIKVVEDCQLIELIKKFLYMKQKNGKRNMLVDGEKNIDYEITNYIVNIMQDIEQNDKHIGEEEQGNIERNLEKNWLNYLVENVKSVDARTLRGNYISITEKKSEDSEVEKKKFSTYINTLKQNQKILDCSVVHVINISIIEKNALLDEGKKLRELLNEHLSEYFSKTYGIPKAPAELGFKAIYSWIMFIGKKNYAAEYIWDEKRGWKTGLDIKGIASVRSDASRVEKAALETLIGMLPPSKNNNDEILEAYIAGVLKDFDDHKYSPMDMAYPAQLKKPLKKNNKGEWIINQVQKLSVKAHYKSAIYSNYFLNTEYLQGDKPRRLPVKFPKLKTAKGQQTLAKTSAFPTEFTYRGKIKKKDGSIITDKVDLKSVV